MSDNTPGLTPVGKIREAWPKVSEHLEIMEISVSQEAYAELRAQQGPGGDRVRVDGALVTINIDLKGWQILFVLRTKEAPSEPLDAQVNRLAKVILNEFDGPTESEGACDTAVRKMREMKDKIIALRVTRQKEIDVVVEQRQKVIEELKTVNFNLRERFAKYRNRLHDLYASMDKES